VGVEEKEVLNIGEGVIPLEDALGAIFRMKFIGALGLDSARENRPAVDVADGGNGCCGCVVVERDWF
jgi:hypothetical protein